MWVRPKSQLSSISPMYKWQQTQKSKGSSSESRSNAELQAFSSVRK